MIYEAREVHGATVAEVSAVAEVEADEFVAGLEACHEYCHICLSARVRLYIGVLSSEELLYAADSEVFNLVDYLAAAIIAFSGVAFGILVCETRAHGTHHFVADIVF